MQANIFDRRTWSYHDQQKAWQMCFQSKAHDTSNSLQVSLLNRTHKLLIVKWQLLRVRLVCEYQSGENIFALNISYSIYCYLSSYLLSTHLYMLSHEGVQCGISIVTFSKSRHASEDVPFWFLGLLTFAQGAWMPIWVGLPVQNSYRIRFSKIPAGTSLHAHPPAVQTNQIAVQTHTPK